MLLVLDIQESVELACLLSEALAFRKHWQQLKRAGSSHTFLRRNRTSCACCHTKLAASACSPSRRLVQNLQ